MPRADRAVRPARRRALDNAGVASHNEPTDAHHKLARRDVLAGKPEYVLGLGVLVNARGCSTGASRQSRMWKLAPALRGIAEPAALIATSAAATRRTSRRSGSPSCEPARCHGHSAPSA